MDKFKYYYDFYYRLRIKSKTMEYDTREYTLGELLDLFQKNKRHIDLKFPLRHQSLTNNILNLLLLKQNCPYTFIIKEDWSFVIGYYDLKVLYRWMRKGYILRYNDMNYKYEDMPQIFREQLENTSIRVRIYDDETNINDIMRIYFGTNIEIYRDPKGDNNLWESEENNQN